MKEKYKIDMLQVVQPKITAEEFCYRLQGYLEIENPDSISTAQGLC